LIKNEQQKLNKAEQTLKLGAAAKAGNYQTAAG
jgi:hypothetical protein